MGGGGGGSREKPVTQKKDGLARKRGGWDFKQRGGEKIQQKPFPMGEFKGEAQEIGGPMQKRGVGGKQNGHGLVGRVQKKKRR